MHGCVHVYTSADRDRGGIPDRLYFSSVSTADYTSACYRSMECGKKTIKQSLEVMAVQLCSVYYVLIYYVQVGSCCILFQFGRLVE